MGRKRGQGEGTIGKRADGRWEGRMTLPGGKRKAVYGKTRKEAQEKLNAALAELHKGVLPPTERQTLRVFLERWLADCVKPSVRPRTHISYSQLVRIHIVPSPIGGKLLTQIAPQDVQALLNERLASGLSPRSVQYIHAVLRRALGQALRWNLVGRNVALLVDPPRTEHHEITPLDHDQARAFLEAAREDRLYALYAVAVALGLRQGEALGLRWEDVDLDGAELHVRHSLQRIERTLQLVEPKTQRSRRTIPLPAPTVAALKEHRTRQKVERVRAGELWQDLGFVFCTEIGTPLDASNVIKSYKKILAQAGLPALRFHDLRHTCASLLAAQHVPAREIMAILGHSQINITMNLYAHVFPGVLREAADKMGKVLG